MAKEIDPAERERRLQWRLRREERRAKQRIANVRRADKMHVIRGADPRPNDPPQLLDPDRRFHVGCSGWYYWHWRDCFYPAELPRKNWFAHYAKQFDTVELNAPFYS